MQGDYIFTKIKRRHDRTNGHVVLRHAPDPAYLHSAPGSVVCAEP